MSIVRLRDCWVRVLVVFAMALTGGCGGGVSEPVPVPQPMPLSVLPGSAVMYSGLPTTFLLSGGNGSYVASSSDQLVIPISGAVDGSSLTLVPRPVQAETNVTLTIRDTGSASPVSVSVAVRPNTVSNEISVERNPAQNDSCSPALCSGSEAEVRFSVSQGGLPLANRVIQFEAITGSFGFVGPTGVAGRVVTASTDASGVARARLRVDTLAPTQTALLRATDLAGGAFREASFAIAYFTGDVPAFFALPETVSFKGPFSGKCADSTAPEATVAVFGGVPPYSVVNSSAAFSVTPTGAGVLTRFNNTLRVRIAGTGTCESGAPVIVTDSLGSRREVRLSNVEGTGTAPTPNIVVTPAALSLSCSFSAVNPTPPPPTTVVEVYSSIVVSGGSAPFYAATSHPRLQLSVSGRVVTVSRLRGDPSGQIYPATAAIIVSDGTRSATATATVPVNCP